MSDRDNSRDWPAFAGVDWGGSEHQLCVLDATGTRLTQQRVTHDVAGLTELDTALAQHGRALPIAVERAEGLLVEHLQARGHTVFPVSPRIAARARERYRVAAVKDDRFDAFVLADTLRHEHPHWRALTPPSPLLAEIKALTRDRDRLQQTQQATESQLRAILEAYHPAPARLFSSVDRQITLHFVLDYPTPAAASRIKTTRMNGFLSRHRYTGRVPGQVLAERLRENLLAASTGTVAGKSYSAQSFARLLQLLNTQLAEYDDAIAAAVTEHPDMPIFASFPGVGPVLTGTLLAEIGEDRARFPTPATLLAESGLAPVTRASGRSRKVRFRYAANTILREAAMWWAYNSMKEAPWAKAAFRDARDQRGQHYHRALRGLAARWMRVLWTCWSTHTPYDPKRHTTAQAALTTG
ncbi:transposase IS111A/IS1328/IS1533 [Pseudonocardia dioxanivorans CB1190]|uniref:Transposase IS111A/IS1328/IS1533 n=1 Tax=Pseudonocardia dioxanivorans (strain ATCC 55486 / DSM 44775 / JCM 13855 / CB1190) TaxID=675635 RepID=F4CLQ4_PSEUX|nr:IS110 family transposase [Pseudonocardia dioxanivorans]AEA23393.1 transposase IS111A/IS1328/IS1533 [Pseudonocardia dioxanivorans CB1190]AEA28186.1 transposase IS111A/IS1328/IS1533 [Pseudonocardia dioxanivorans CB1190]